MLNFISEGWLTASGGIYAVIILLLVLLVIYLFIKNRRYSRIASGNITLLKALTRYSQTSDLIIDNENVIRFANEHFLNRFKLSESLLYQVKVENSQLPEKLKKFISNTEKGEDFIKPDIHVSVQPLYTKPGKKHGKLIRCEMGYDKGHDTVWAADLAHQINTPLNAISGYSELLENETSLSGEQTEYLKVIRKQAKILKKRIHRYISDSNNPYIDQQISGRRGKKIEHILIVDDVTINRTLLRVMLTRKGYKVTEAANGQEGIDSFKEQVPDMVLMDIRMPIMDGIEAVKRIRNLTQQNGHIPVIAVTASSVFDDSNSLSENGFDGLLRKPFKEKTLFKLIERFTPGESEVLLNEQGKV